jgi:hypothetical protein
MTRKHFRLIAAIIAKIENISERKAMAELNAVTCARSNPRFNRAKFFAACNVQ